MRVSVICFSQTGNTRKVADAFAVELAGKPAFVFATSGGAPGNVLYDQTLILCKKARM